MVTFDTNVVIRLLVEDDPTQSLRAIDIWQSALETGGVFLPKVVIVETVWVLRFSYHFDRQTIVEILRNLLSMEGVSVEDKNEVTQALVRFSSSIADFSDCLILVSAQAADALPVYTFDRRFSRENTVQLVS